MGLGFELLAMFLVGAYIGRLLDEHFGWNGLGFISMIGILFVAWVTHFVFLIKRFMKPTNDTDPKP
jgi:F0F1-type ATP synthase assembly protein I